MKIVKIVNRILCVLLSLIVVLWISDWIHVAKKKQQIHKEMECIVMLATEIEPIFRENIDDIEYIIREVKNSDVVIRYHSYQQRTTVVSASGSANNEVEIEAALREKSNLLISKFCKYGGLEIAPYGFYIHPDGTKLSTNLLKNEPNSDMFSTTIFLSINSPEFVERTSFAVSTIKRIERERKWNIDIAFIDPALRKWAKEIVDKEGRGLLD